MVKFFIYLSVSLLNNLDCIFRSILQDICCCALLNKFFIHANPDCGSVQTEQPPSSDFTLSNQDLRRNVPYQNHPLSEDSNLRPAQYLADTHVQSSLQNVDRLLFRHWPNLQPLTHVDEEMFDFLNQDDIPKFFILPTSSASLMKIGLKSDFSIKKKCPKRIYDGR